jgi:hypothetical protein
MASPAGLNVRTGDACSCDRLGKLRVEQTPNLLT